MTYFSEREEGVPPQENESIGEIAWGGIWSLVRALINDGSFGARYPEVCPDGRGPIGSDEDTLWSAVRAEIPNLTNRQWDTSSAIPPRSLDILDMVEFCWRCIGKPINKDYHAFFTHYHLEFDVEKGRSEFLDDINRIFRRNGLAYELMEDGRVERLATPVLREELAVIQFRTGDEQLDRMLETARRKFLNPNEDDRREALEALWDAWERLKTLGTGSKKKTQVKSLLDATAGSSSSKLRDVLYREAVELTRIGNQFQIRHSEVDQERVAESRHVDYFFHRLLSLIQVICKARKLS